MTNEKDNIISPQVFYKNNENFFLKKADLVKLIQKKAAVWKDRSVSYKSLYIKNPEYFESLLQKSMNSIVRTDTTYDILLLYANFDRLRDLILDLPITDELKYKQPYTLYKPSTVEEAKELIQNYRLFDIETTWFWLLDQIIQFGIWIFENWRMKQKAEFYVEKYKATIPPDVIKLTWITNEKIQQEWKSIDKVLDAIYKLLHWQVICWHNISFDMDKITELFIDFKRIPPVPEKIIDSIDIFKLIIKEKKIVKYVKNNKLDTLTKFFTWIDINELEERHTAIFDVYVTHNVLTKAFDFTKYKLIKKEILLENQEIWYEKVLTWVDITKPLSWDDCDKFINEFNLVEWDTLTTIIEPLKKEDYNENNLEK